MGGLQKEFFQVVVETVFDTSKFILSFFIDEFI